jgi:hypothetical protein
LWFQISSSTVRKTVLDSRNFERGTGVWAYQVEELLVPASNQADSIFQDLCPDLDFSSVAEKKTN